MRIFDADPPIVKELLEESEPQGKKEVAAFTVVTARHPTLGKLVIVTARDGTGVVVAADE